MTTPTPRHLDDRHESSWTAREKAGRMLWAVVQHTVFRLSPYPCDRWRTFLLRRFGATIGQGCVIRRTAKIEVPWNLTMGNHVGIGESARLYSLGPITLQDYTTVSQYSHLCAGSHDHTLPHTPLLREPIVVCRHAWVASDAFVGPGVTIETGAILGARGCAFKDLEAWTIYGGNPAKPIKPRILKYDPPTE